MRNFWNHIVHIHMSLIGSEQQNYSVTMCRYSASARSRATDSSTTSLQRRHDLRLELTTEARARKKQTRKSFKSERRTYLQTMIPNDIHQKTKRETRCAQCNVNNQHSVKRKKYDLNYRTCDVHLCKETFIFRTSC